MYRGSRCDMLRSQLAHYNSPLSLDMIHQYRNMWRFPCVWAFVCRFALSSLYVGTTGNIWVALSLHFSMFTFGLLDHLLSAQFVVRLQFGGWRIRDQLDVINYYVLFHFFYAQHVSDINTSIIRSLRLFYWSLLHRYHPNPATPKLQHTSKQEHTTNVVIQ